ncbi:uncharacterized protein CCOS01_05634 [Colletotrichum costaricense]|uniref:Uncharacterized protein n=2 Tax=Colletotrichum acutatum species complex TaxID=2707335 RepID=A0AAJ0E214_9PEZI|nr:uncharacterized protein CCOS01_05634 [Colletotrichum costaricense]XP_060388453.1 uncharacterized protein CTAM01_00947 [Colletotrichum tamarilloi]KAK1512017.1 hypothetical protein CTAM01_00947 [Colletotrichum tamarilloi]KAK1530531.1 hypothetical protein CCOS01_05634 [Colletotrichum costaricense]
MSPTAMVLVDRIYHNRPIALVWSNALSVLPRNSPKSQSMDSSGTLCNSASSPSPSTAAQTIIPAWSTDVPVWNAPQRRIWPKMVLPCRNPSAALRRLPRRTLQALPASNHQQWVHEMQPLARPTYLGGPKKRASLPEAPAGIQGGEEEGQSKKNPLTNPVRLCYRTSDHACMACLASSL